MKFLKPPVLISYSIVAAIFLFAFFGTSAASAQGCGSAGQRACCLFEASFGACRDGNFEIPRANSGRCGGFNPTGIQSSGICVAETPCGGTNQRACCLFEESFGACRDGRVEQPQANSGYCTGGVLGSQSSGICRAVSACGGPDQRACCLGEESFGACRDGNVEVPQANSGQCANSIWGIQSSGVCRVVTDCGGPGQRACCIGEESFGACESGLVEVPQANSGFCGGSVLGIQSSGVCEVVTSCGGPGERACCVGEASFGACGSGLVEVPQANSGFCGNSILGIQSSGVCEVVTPCGGEGQRACCIGEASFGACEDGLNERPQANSGFCGGSILGIQSSGVCQAAQALGEACGPLYQCEEGLFCDPFAGFTCVDSAGIDQACGPGVPCEDGLQCSLAFRCSEIPAQLGQTCDVTAQCGDGLFCQPGIPQRCREFKKPGEGCSIVNPCISGASCDPCLVEGCNAPLQCNLNSNEGAISEAACRALYSPDLAAAARDTGLTMIYGVGNEIAGIIGESQTFGVAYGQNEEFGCFTTLCGGLNADVSIEFFATIGFYEGFDLVGGSSFANFQEVEIVGVLNFGTSQVFPRVGVLPIGELIGTESSFALGVSPDLLPFSAGSFICQTVLDYVMVEPDMEDLPEVPSRPATVVANSGLRFDLVGWECSDPDLCEWSDDDAQGLVTSGSAQVSSPASSGPDSSTTIIAPCVSVQPGQNYSLSAYVKTLGARPGLVRARWYAGLECNSDVVETYEVGSSEPDEIWREIKQVRQAPDGAQSVALEIVAERDEVSAIPTTSRFDFVMVSPTTANVSGGGGDSGGGGGGGCGLIGLEPFLVLGGIRFAQRRRKLNR